MGGLRGSSVTALLKDDSLIQDLAKALVAELEAAEDQDKGTPEETGDATEDDLGQE